MTNMPSAGPRRRFPAALAAFVIILALGVASRATDVIIKDGDTIELGGYLISARWN
jgi:hypothetical protein